MWIACSVLPNKLAATFQSSFSHVKMITHYEVHVIFQDMKHQLQKHIPHHFLTHSFL